jgi:hypothetical protein
MKKQLLPILAILLFLPQLSLASKNGDFQYSARSAVKVKVAKDIKLTAFQEIGLDNNAGNLYYLATDLGIVYTGFADWLEIRAHNRIISGESESDWDMENRAILDFILKYPLWNLELSDRNRVEFRFIEDSEYRTRYRNRVKIAMPLEVGRTTIKPYIADEVFFDSNRDGLDKNRVYSGIVLDIFKNTTLEIQYFWQLEGKREGSMDSINAVRTFLTLSF